MSEGAENLLLLSATEQGPHFVVCSNKPYKEIAFLIIEQKSQGKAGAAFEQFLTQLPNT